MICRTRSITLLLAFTALALASGSVSAQGSRDKLSLEDYLNWEDVFDFFGGGPGPQISPDGKQVIYSRRWVDKMNDRWRSALWIVNSDGGHHRFLADGAGAMWSPDGSRTAFVKAADDGTAQIFVRWMDAEGATSQITRLDRGPGSLAWSPDGKWIAFTMTVPDPETWMNAAPTPPAGAKWNPPPKVVTRLQYRADHVGYIDDGYAQLFVVSADGGTPRQLTTGRYSHAQPAWTPSGQEILVTSLRVPDAEHVVRESEIYAVNVASGAVRQLTTRKGPDESPVVSPDGKWVAYTGFDWTDDTYVAEKLYVMAIDGSQPREISGTLDRSPGHLMWARDGSGVYFTAADRGSIDLYFASAVAPGQPRRLTSGIHGLTATSMSADGHFAATQSTNTDPGNIVVFDTRNFTPRKITALNDDLLAGKKLGAFEEFWYPSLDGLKIQGWILKPPGFDPSKKYPLMLAIHGGPHAMYSSAAYPIMWFEWQYYAGQGNVILFTNPRGSTGYGSAFGNAIKNAYPGKDYDDLMTGVDTVVKRGYIDAKNMFVYGCSGGGVLTAWTVGHTDRFAAASSECPVIDWFSFVGTTDGPDWYYNFAKFPWEDPSEHIRRSPLSYVGNVKTPTLLITGESDLRTPIGQTEEYYQALKIRKVPTAMVRLKNEWHAYFGIPSNYLNTLSYRKSWFERYTTRSTVP